MPVPKLGMTFSSAKNPQGGRSPPNGLILNRYREAKAKREEARLRYEQTALNTFREVANSLVTREKLEAIRTEQARAVKAYEEAVQLSMQRYTENTLAQTELNQLLVIVQLYKALGGGWEFKNDPQAATEQDSASSNKETIKH